MYAIRSYYVYLALLPRPDEPPPGGDGAAAFSRLARLPGRLPGAARPALLFLAFTLLFSAPWALRNALAYDTRVVIDPRVLAKWGARARTGVVYLRIMYAIRR